MKILVVVVAAALVGTAWTLEREQESGTVEEQSEQTPITSVKPIVDDEKETGGEEPHDAKCSRLICQIKCRMNGCFESECADDGRCKCYCRRQVDPFEHFFRSIVSSHMEPGLRVRVRPFGGFPGFNANPLHDFKKLIDEMSHGKSDGTNKIFVTMQQSCHGEEDCSVVCTNCTSTQCNDNLCQCTGCQRDDDIDSRVSNVAHTCRSARNCVDHCKGCVKTACRYGACECGRCSAVEGESTTAAPSTTERPEETSSATEILTVRNNQTAIEGAASSTCVPKRCNHSCRERQCSKWSCKADTCECDGCPDEVAVIVKNGEAKSAEDNNKYELIF